MTLYWRAKYFWLPRLQFYYSLVRHPVLAYTFWKIGKVVERNLKNRVEGTEEVFTSPIHIARLKAEGKKVEKSISLTVGEQATSDNGVWRSTDDNRFPEIKK